METQYPQLSEKLLKPMSDVQLDSTPTTLLVLAPEIRLDILDYIKTPSDLKSLCLTCKVLAASSTIQLYRKVTLPVTIINQKLCKSLNAQNRGLQHVKILEGCGDGPTSYNEACHGQYLRHLLSALPLNSLTYICIYTRCGVSYDIKDLIFRTQSRLLNHQAHVSGLTGSIRSPLRLDYLQSITALTLSIERSEDTARYTGVLSRLRHLVHLDVIIVEPSDESNLPDARTFDVVRALFAAHTSCDRPELQLGLKSLYLENFDFQYCAQDLVDFLQAIPIESLSFALCADTWRVLHRCRHHPSSLEYFMDEEFSGDHGIVPSTDVFLESFSGLKRLKRTYEPFKNEEWENCKGFGWNAIQAHAETLRILEIHDVLTDTECWKPHSHRSMDGFQVLCSKLVHLQQLAIRPPDVNPEASRMPGSFKMFLDCLKHLKSLTSLKLMVRPESLKDTEAFKFECRVPRLTEYEMQELADTVFDTLYDSCPRFTALVLYATGMWDSESSLNRLYGKDFGFMRGFRSDQYGRSKASAHPVPSEHIKYHEPCSEIFGEFYRQDCGGDIEI